MRRWNEQCQRLRALGQGLSAVPTREGRAQRRARKRRRVGLGSVITVPAAGPHTCGSCSKGGQGGDGGASQLLLPSLTPGPAMLSAAGAAATAATATSGGYSQGLTAERNASGLLSRIASQSTWQPCGAAGRRVGGGRGTCAQQQSQRCSTGLRSHSCVHSAHSAHCNNALRGTAAHTCGMAAHTGAPAASMAPRMAT